MGALATSSQILLESLRHQSAADIPAIMDRAFRTAVSGRPGPVLVDFATCYRHEPSTKACYIFVDAGADRSRAARILGLSPQSKLIFASGGKHLIELPAEEAAQDTGFAGPGELPYAPVMRTRTAVNEAVASGEWRGEETMNYE